jgi:hypothetical protein
MNSAVRRKTQGLAVFTWAGCKLSPGPAGALRRAKEESRAVRSYADSYHQRVRTPVVLGEVLWLGVNPDADSEPDLRLRWPGAYSDAPGPVLFD